MKDSILDELFTGDWKTPLEVKFPEGTEDIREKESDIHDKVEELLGENGPLLDEMLAERFSYEAIFKTNISNRRQTRLPIRPRLSGGG